MNISELPPDATREFLFYSTPQEVINYCTTNKELLAVCGDRAFLNNYIYNNFGDINLSHIKYGESYWDKFIFVYDLIMKARAWDLGKSSFPSSITVYQTLPYENPQIWSIFTSPSLDKLLATAISSGSAGLFETVLREVINNDPVWKYKHHPRHYDQLLTNIFITLIDGAIPEMVHNTFQTYLLSKILDDWGYNPVIRNRINKDLESIKDKIDYRLLAFLKYYNLSSDIGSRNALINDIIVKNDPNRLNKFLYWIDNSINNQHIEFAQNSGYDEIVSILRDYVEKYPNGYASYIRNSYRTI